MKAHLAYPTLALMCMLNSGCTLIGISIGIAVDNKHGQSQQATSSEVKTIPRGRDVQVTLTSGDTLRGKSAGMRALPADSYRCAYDSAQTQWAADSLLPPLGEVVFVVPWQGRCFSGVFHGFEGKALLIRRTGDDTLTSLLPPDIVRMKKYFGRYYDMGRLCAVASERDLPSRREFALQCGEQIRRIPLQHIQQVYAPAKVTYHWLLGALVGLAVDAAVVEFIRWELNKPWEGGSTDNWFPSL